MPCFSFGLRSSYFQTRETDQYENDGNNPETNNNLGFSPTFEFKMMMQWRHSKYALARHFEGGDLNDDRQGLDDEDTSHNCENNFLTHHNSDCA